MIALDTNVILRFLVADDPQQQARAREFLEAHAAKDGHPPELFVPAVVVCELLWVLKTAYRIPRAEQVRILGALLESRDFAFGDQAAIHAAFAAFRDRRGDFADYFIRENGLAAGCSRVVTFDETMQREPGFVAP